METLLLLFTSKKKHSSPQGFFENGKKCNRTDHAIATDVPKPQVQN
ncbi:hypothetical protein [Cylindrospermopsis raciborskii]|nr:hypothetical protein [Cylindrospermopsis raciborskii]